MTSYYVGINGQQKGPFSLPQLEIMFNTKKIQLIDLCWTEGMESWQPISQVLPEVGVQPDQEAFNPYLPPATQSIAPTNDLKSYYGGINRLTYFGCNFLLGLLSLTLTNPIFLFILVALSLVIVALRLKNIGMNPWFCLLGVLPIVNIFIGYRCIACQEGYADTQILDGTGRVITWIFGGFCALVLIGAIIGSFN